MGNLRFFIIFLIFFSNQALLAFTQQEKTEKAKLFMRLFLKILQILFLRRLLKGVLKQP